MLVNIILTVANAWTSLLSEDPSTVDLTMSFLPTSYYKSNCITTSDKWIRGQGYSECQFSSKNYKIGPSTYSLNKKSKTAPPQKKYSARIKEYRSEYNIDLNVISLPNHQLWSSTAQLFSVVRELGARQVKGNRIKMWVWKRPTSLVKPIKQVRVWIIE